jgi:hypothetical protein
MAAIANAVISRASTLLLDITGVRWPATELLVYLCDGQREAASIKPNIYVKFAALPLVPGPRQAMPADARELKEITRNVNGSAIRSVSRELMDAHIPTWYTSQPKSTVMHSMYSDLDPLTFFVYPPQPATGSGAGSVEMTYFAIPADIAVTDRILIPDTYIGALVDYILYRAFSKDTEYAANADTAQEYLASFNASIVGKSAVEKQT